MDVGNTAYLSFLRLLRGSKVLDDACKVYFVGGCPAGGTTLTLARLCLCLCLTLTFNSGASKGALSGNSASCLSNSLLSCRMDAIVANIFCSWRAAFLADTLA